VQRQLQRRLLWRLQNRLRRRLQRRLRQYRQQRLLSKLIKKKKTGGNSVSAGFPPVFLFQLNKKELYGRNTAFNGFFAYPLRNA
jgi:hypothetical protein